MGQGHATTAEQDPDALPEEPEPPFPEQHQAPPGQEHDLTPRPRYRLKNYRPAGKLEGRVALITGGDSGIGRAVAVAYAMEGADVAILHLPEEEQDARETEDAITEEGRQVSRIAGDVRDFSVCERAVEETVRELGGLDILVNNAAKQVSQTRPEDVSLDQWRATFDTNITGYFHMVKAALPHLESGDCIINSGSVAGLRGSTHLLDYAATKGAIHAFTKSLALQLVDRGIRVNCVAPGPVWTPLNPADQPAEKVAHFGESSPKGRPAQPEEIAPAYVYLASNPDSSYVTGEVIAITGGETQAG